MVSITASEAQFKLYDLIEETGLSHKPLIIRLLKKKRLSRLFECWHIMNRYNIDFISFSFFNSKLAVKLKNNFWKRSIIKKHEY